MKIGFYLGKVQRATHGGGHTFEINFINSLFKKIIIFISLIIIIFI